MNRICPPLARPVLGKVVGRQHLHFLDHVHVLDADCGAGRPRPDGHGPVDRNRVLVAPASVDAEAAVGERRETRVVEAAADDTRFQGRHADRVAAREREQLDVLGLDGLPDRDIGLNRRGRGDHRDRFREAARLKDKLHPDCRAAVERQARAVGLLEPVEFGGDIVLARPQRGHRVVPARVGDRRCQFLRLQALGRDRGAGDNAPGLVLDDARDRAAVKLGGCGRGQQQHADECHHATKKRGPNGAHLPPPGSVGV